MNEINWKQILISILVGATVAFFSSLFEGLSELFKGLGNDVMGGATATLIYISKTFRG